LPPNEFVNNPFEGTPMATDSAVQPGVDPARRRSLIIMCVGTVVYLLSLVPAVAVITATIISGADSGGRWGLEAIFATVAYPVVCIAALIVGWVLHAIGKYRRAFHVMLAPLVWAALVALFIVAMFW
jgi:hypothetical protein